MPALLLLLGLGVLFAMSRPAAAPRPTPGGKTLPPGENVTIPWSKVPRAPSRGLQPGEQYLVKYMAQALQLAAFPSTKAPVTLCSYVPFATLESLDQGQADLQRLQAKYETPVEQTYPHLPAGRRVYVRLLKLFFDPATQKELPSEILYQSDQKLPVPTLDLHGPADILSSDDGALCG
jgi:hypothetical protein